MTLYIFGPAFSTLVRSVQLYAQENGLALAQGLAPDGQAVALGSAAHRALHPFAQVPVLLHGERRIFETLAICRYLERISAAPARDDGPCVDAWASALVTTVDRRLVRDYLLRVAGPRPARDLSTADRVQAQHRVAGTLAVLEAQLGERPFLCSPTFSVADALLAPMLDYLARLPQPRWLAGRPRLDAYLQRLRRRTSGQAILLAPDFAPVLSQP